MDNSLDEEEFKFTLFSDIKHNVLAMREHLHEKVSEAIREELVAEIASQHRNYVRECAELDDYDDIPLQTRLDDVSVKENEKNTKEPGRNCCSRKGEKKAYEHSTPSISDEVTEIECQNAETIEIIDSDNELSTSLPNSSDQNKSLNYSIDEITIDEEEEDDDDDDDSKLFSVKINWMNVRVHRFELRKFQKFTSVFEQLAEKENVLKENILLILRDEIFISKDDSPDSLKLSIADIIEGGITKEKVDNKFKRKCSDDEKDSMVFKCVMKDRKKPLMISIKQTDSMKRLMLKASEELECSLDKLKFMFEGEELDSAARPKDLDLEGGEVFDIHIKT